MIVSPSEFAAILAALRFFQDEFQTVQPAELIELFPQFESAAPLSWAEISSLCERLNMPEPAECDELCDCEIAGFFCAVTAVDNAPHMLFSTLFVTRLRTAPSITPQADDVLKYTSCFV